MTKKGTSITSIKCQILQIKNGNIVRYLVNKMLSQGSKYKVYCTLSTHKQQGFFSITSLWELISLMRNKEKKNCTKINCQQLCTYHNLRFYQSLNGPILITFLWHLKIETLPNISGNFWTKHLQIVLNVYFLF